MLFFTKVAIQVVAILLTEIFHPSVAFAAEKKHREQLRSDQLQNAQTPALSRKKRFIFTLLLVTGLVVGTAATTVAAVDMATDSAAFYPSITGYKNKIRLYEDKIGTLAEEMKGRKRTFEAEAAKAEKVSQLLQRLKKAANEISQLSLDLADSDLLLHEMGFSIPDKFQFHKPQVVSIVFVSLNALTLPLYIPAIASSLSAAASAASTASMAVSGAFSVVGIVAGGVSIGFTIDSGRKKRDQYRQRAEALERHYNDMVRINDEVVEAQKKFDDFLEVAREQVQVIVKKKLALTDCDVKMDELVQVLGFLAEEWANIILKMTEMVKTKEFITKSISQAKRFGWKEAEGVELYNDLKADVPEAYQALLALVLRKQGFNLGTWSDWDSANSECKEGPDPGLWYLTRVRTCLSAQCVGPAETKEVCQVNPKQLVPERTNYKKIVDVMCDGGAAYGWQQEATRLWGHFGARRVSTVSQCGDACREHTDCYAATWDPKHAAGNTYYNCFLYDKRYTVTTEKGYTAIFFRDKELVQCFTRDSTRFWGHIGADKVSTKLKCSQICEANDKCHAATWDPGFRAGNKNVNCFIYGKDYGDTSEKGFTSVVCRSAGYFYITSELNGKVVTVDRGTLEPTMNSKHGGDNQLWNWEGETLVSKYLRRRLEVSDERAKEHDDRFRWIREGRYLVTKVNNDVLDIDGANKDDGAKLISWKRHGKDNQRWKIEIIAK